MDPLTPERIADLAESARESMRDEWSAQAETILALLAERDALLKVVEAADDVRLTDQMQARGPSGVTLANALGVWKASKR